MLDQVTVSPQSLAESDSADHASCRKGSLMTIVSETHANVDVQVDPRHVFLNAGEVIARYRWSRSKGYQNLKDRELVPAPVMRRPDRWRLDQLMAWEDRRFAEAMKPAKAAAKSTQKSTSMTSVQHDLDSDAHRRLAALLPQPRTRRSARAKNQD